MTIKEYKKEFLRLYQQMQEEHGTIEEVSMERAQYEFMHDDIKIHIRF